MDYEALARQLMRALRGSRSQQAFSRRLGYSTNVAYAWESGRRSPTASEALRAAMRTGVDVKKALTPFFQQHLPEELEKLDPAKPAFVAGLLRALRGAGSMQSLADKTLLSRSAISRILSGTTQPRLPVFLELVDIMSRRLVDLLASFADVATLPAAASEWQRVEALRRLAFDNPLSEAVPRFIELEQYERLERHEPGWIAERLGISLAEEQRTLAALERAGVIHWDGTRYKQDRGRSVDTSRFDRRAAQNLRAHWTDLARRRIQEEGAGLFSYLVFSTDDETLAAIEELRKRFFREMRTLVASSSVGRRVAVANVHLFPIDVGTKGGLTGPGSTRTLDVQ